MIDCIFYVKIGGKGLITIEDWVNIEKASTQKCKKEAHHGKFFTDTEPVMDEKSWVWIQKGIYEKRNRGNAYFSPGPAVITEKVHKEKSRWGR